MLSKKNVLFLLVFLLLSILHKVRARGIFEVKTDSLKNCLIQFTENDTNRVKTLLDLAYWYNTFDISQSLIYLAEAEKITQQLNTPLYVAKVHFTYGNSYLKQASYQRGLFHFMQALHIFEQLKKKENIARCLYNIGVIYTNLNKIDQAEKYFTQAVDIKLKHGLIDEIGIAYTGLGYVAELKKEYPKALKYYKKTLANGVETNNQYIIQIAHCDIGNIYLKQKNIAMAKKYLSLGLKMAREAKNIEQICIACLSLGDANVKEGNVIQAESYFFEAIAQAQKAGVKSQEMMGYKNLSELYHKLKQYDKAYYNRLKYEALNDSALNQETYKQVNDLQITYEIEKRNNEINLLSKDKEIAQANASKDLLFRNILITVCILVLVIAFILLRNVRLKQHLNRTLKTENKQLEEENILAKYEVLKSRVNPHFLFNSLNTLTSIIADDKHKAIEFIEHFSELYRRILESGEIGFITLQEEINLSQNYIYLQQVRFGNKLHIDFKTSDTSTYTVPSFAIQMMIENAIKHNVISTAKNLFISITQQSSSLIIENNLQPKVADTPSTRIGQQNIIDRYKQFSNILPTFERTETHYKVTIPLIYTPLTKLND